MMTAIFEALARLPVQYDWCVTRNSGLAIFSFRDPGAVRQSYIRTESDGFVLQRDGNTVARAMTERDVVRHIADMTAAPSERTTVFDE